MPTPNSASQSMFDIHADPEFAAQFEVSPGRQDLGPTTVRGREESRFDLPRNVGRTEQKIRLIAGAALVTAAAVAPIDRRWRLAMAILGATELVTGATRYCPLWQGLGVNTNRR